MVRNIFLSFCGAIYLASVMGGSAAVSAPDTAGEALDKRPSLDLSGTWEFNLDPQDAGRAEKWFDGTIRYARSIQVPGSWNAQGMAFPSEKQLREYEDQQLEEQKSLNKLGILGVQRESDRLFSVYPGPAWYRKEVTIPADWRGKVPWLIFDGVHREAEVWVNGHIVGEHHSYLTPLRINLSEHAKAGERILIAVRVDARRRKDVDPLMGCLDTLDFLYVNWGGLHGRVRLEATETVRIDDLFVLPQLATEKADIHLTLSGTPTAPLVAVVDVLEANGALVETARQSIATGVTNVVLSASIPKPKLWSPKAPYLYTVRARMLSDDAVRDVRSVRFGMREFKVAGGKFLLNGKSIFLRGYGEDCIFPNTICPPASKTEFHRRLLLARSYGFNYVRHHSWTPPTEYLEVADELGMMLQPEFPFAYRWDLPLTPEARHAALEQWEKIIRLNRNHPSIVAWCMGNEQYDSFDLAPEMYRIAKRLDPTRPVIDSDGCNFKHKDRDTLDFLVVQFGEGNSIGFNDGKYNFPGVISKPVIAHEMGYFVTLPDLRQFELFQGGIRPYWLQQARDLAEHNGLTASYSDWLAASYRLQAASLKSNQEAARRSRLSGTSVWLFQDYPNCAEGVVDMFLRPKGVSAEEFRKFNSPTVILLDMPRRNFRSGESVDFKFAVSRFEDEPSVEATLRWELKTGTEQVASGSQERLQITADGVQELPPIQLELPRLDRASQFTLVATLVDTNGKTENSWSLWVYPTTWLADGSHKIRSSGFDALATFYPSAFKQSLPPMPTDTDLLVAKRLGTDEINYLKAGGRIILLEPEPTFSVEKTNFRLSSWDGGGPSGTILDRAHPALREMPSDGWCDLQFYPLIQGSKTVMLSSIPTKIQPLVRCIDRPTRLADRAYLFEVSVGQGKLLVSGFNFARAIDSKDPGGMYLFDRLVRYALGPDFVPAVSVSEETLGRKATQ